MSQINFEQRFHASELNYASLPIEIRDEDYSLVLRTTSGQTVELNRGIYHVIVQLPAGQVIRQHIEVEDDKTATVHLEPDSADESPQESLGVSNFFLAPVMVPKLGRRSIQSVGSESEFPEPLSSSFFSVIEQQRKTLGKLVVYSGNLLAGTLQSVAVNISYPTVSELILQLRLNGVGPNTYAQLVQPNRAPTNLALPCGEQYHCNLAFVFQPPDRLLPDAHPHNIDAHALLRYIQEGEMNQVTALLASDAITSERLLMSKMADPIGAAIGAYALLRMNQLDRLHNWTQNLSDWFRWLPDGAVVRGEHLARLGKHDEALLQFMELTQRGLPIFTRGLIFAIDRLRYYAELAKHGQLIAPNTERVAALLEQLRMYAAYTDFTRPLLTFTGLNLLMPDFDVLDQQTYEIQHGEILDKYLANSTSTGVKTVADERNDQYLIHFNGVDGNTGQYFTPPISPTRLVNEYIIGKTREESREELENLRLRRQYDRGGFFGVTKGDPSKPEEVGWGIIFAENAPQELRDALRPLMDWRRKLVGNKRYREYVYKSNEQKVAFLLRHGTSPGPVDPDKMPYYLLLVGDPNQIPYRFQHLLDVEYAVGRIDFGNDWKKYKNYANSVVEAEQNQTRRKKVLTFFGPQNKGDNATAQSVQHLIQPLAATLRQELRDTDVKTIVEEDATKNRLGKLLGGDETPALLFTASHGLAFAPGDTRQRREQGALICQEWLGPNSHVNQPLPRTAYFCGEDLQSDVRLGGMMAFFFACYSGGTPHLNAFYRQEQLATPNPIASESFTAYLPQQMLSHPNGGALAVVAHVERANSYSFVWGIDQQTGQANPQTQLFEATLRQLLEGVPVGHALDFFNSRYADIATELNELRGDKAGGAIVPDEKLAWYWTASNDARNYIVLGDPAVRLNVDA